MNLNYLLTTQNIDPESVLVLRHRPSEPELNKVLPSLAADKPDIFNAYQQTQTEKVEKSMTRAAYVASFIGNEPGEALFVGLYTIGASKSLTIQQFWRVPAYIELKTYGMRGPKEGRSSILWFDLTLTDFCASWRGKLIVAWPPPERTWCRRAHKNNIPIIAILEESALEAAMPPWNEVDLRWNQLEILPKSWKNKLKEWRGIYYIFDTSDGKGYVGSACVEKNLLGRWQGYAASGDGGNVLLRKRDPQHFRFSILERVSPDMSPEDVIHVEGTWKDRLHTRSPYGLNDN